MPIITSINEILYLTELLRTDIFENEYEINLSVTEDKEIDIKEIKYKITIAKKIMKKIEYAVHEEYERLYNLIKDIFII